MPVTLWAQLNDSGLFEILWENNSYWKNISLVLQDKEIWDSQWSGTEGAYPSFIVNTTETAAIKNALWPTAAAEYVELELMDDDACDAFNRNRYIPGELEREYQVTWEDLWVNPQPNSFWCFWSTHLFISFGAYLRSPYAPTVSFLPRP